MKNKSCIALILVMLLWSGTLSAQQGTAVRVAVMPFDIFSMEETPNLGRELSIQLSQQMALNPRILTCSYDVIASVLQSRKNKRLDEAGLSEIAKALDAQFVVFGSLTKIQTDMSLDVQLFNSAEKGAYFKAFAEGTVLEALIQNIAQKLEPEIMKKAALIAPEQRITAAQEPKPETTEELLAEEKGKQPQPAEQAPPAAEEKKIAPTTALPPAPIREEAVPEEDFVEPPPSPPAAEKKEARLAPTPAGKEEKSAKGGESSQQKKGLPSLGSNLPVNINADTLEYDNKRNMVAFKGHVVARQGDMVIFADAMNVTYEPKGKLKQIEAQGGVKIIQADRIATGDTITYYNEEQKIVLNGNPRVWQGDNVINGEKITVFIKEERSIVEGSPANRVSATIVPKKKGQKISP
jgi:lipopolysaccharide export system protein LptA